MTAAVVGGPFVIHHYTTGAFLTADNGLTRDIRQADTFVTREGANVIWTALEDFRTAWEVLPLVGLDWPVEFPGAWQHWPAELQAVTARLLLARHVAEFGTSDLVKHIVTFHWRHDPTAPALLYGARAEKFWPSFLALARRTLAAPPPVHPSPPPT